MRLFREKLDMLLGESDMIRKYGVRVRVLGDLNLLPEHVRSKVNEVMAMTEGYSKCTLNICCPYTSTHELTQAYEKYLRERDLSQSDTELLHQFERHLFTADNPPLDLLIRTSGETRLSDFMCWQVSQSNAMVVFSPVLWPDFSVWNFVHILNRYCFATKTPKIIQ
jgi:ditrans,polycis-polyprenyl diphosphate synthase